MKDDVIYRQVAIKAIEDLPNCYNGFSDTYDKSCIIGVLEELPSAQPERRGKWVYYKFDTSKEHRWRKCTQCGTAHLMGEEIPGRLTLMWRDFKFCPSCGAKMEAEE